MVTPPKMSFPFGFAFNTNQKGSPNKRGTPKWQDLVRSSSHPKGREDGLAELIASPVCCLQVANEPTRDVQSIFLLGVSFLGDHQTWIPFSLWLAFETMQQGVQTLETAWHGLVAPRSKVAREWSPKHVLQPALPASKGLKTAKPPPHWKTRTAPRIYSNDPCADFDNPWKQSNS